MGMLVVKRMVVGALTLAVWGAGVQAARADLISLDTFTGSGWQVQRILVGGESDPTAYVGPVVQTINTPGNGGTPGPGTWITFNNPTQSPYDPNAKWVSWNALSGNTRFLPNGYWSDVDGTSYIYTDTFTLGNLGGGAELSLNGTMAFDNYVSSVTLTANGASVPITLSPTPAPTEFGYYIPMTIQSTYDFSVPTQFVLTVHGVNSSSQGAGPTGFIFTGTASTVPTPEPASLALLALGAAGLLVRRRRG